MDFLLAGMFFLLCVALMYRMVKSRDVVDFQLGVIALFSIGYFCLPVWFEDLSRLRFYEDARVAEAIFIFFLFLLFVTFGTWVGRPLAPVAIAFRTEALDAYLVRHRKGLTVAAFGWYVYYYSTYELTSYSAQDFEAYLSGAGGASAIATALANIALGWIALNVALALRDRRLGELWVSSLFLVTCVIMLVVVGQRLAFLSPIVMLMASLALTGQGKRAGKTLVVGVVALLVVSPVAVAVREAPAGMEAVEAVASFDYGDRPVETVFQSVIDRGDLLYVAVEMTSRLDDDPLPGWTYYSSVFLSPIPSALFPDDSKPYLLSTDGTPAGELSIYAWRSLVGPTSGSLSAFGGLVAYRELDWVGVVLNGLLTGIAFVFLYRWLGLGGLLCKVFYSGLFVALTVKKVPPSFWETIGELMPLLPFLLLVFIVEKSFTRKNGSTGRRVGDGRAKEAMEAG